MNDTRLKILDRQKKGSGAREPERGFVPGVLYGRITRVNL